MQKLIAKNASLSIDGKPVDSRVFGPLPPAGWSRWPARFGIVALRNFGGRMVDVDELRADEGILNSLGITGKP